MKRTIWCVQVVENQLFFAVFCAVFSLLQWCLHELKSRREQKIYWSFKFKQQIIGFQNIEINIVFKSYIFFLWFVLERLMITKTMMIIVNEKLRVLHSLIKSLNNLKERKKENSDRWCSLNYVSAYSSFFSFTIRQQNEPNEWRAKQQQNNMKCETRVVHKRWLKWLIRKAKEHRVVVKNI